MVERGAPIVSVVVSIKTQAYRASDRELKNFAGR